MRGKFDSTLLIPTICGVPNSINFLHSNITNRSAVLFDSCGGKFYIWSPSSKVWSDVSGTVNSSYSRFIYSTIYGTSSVSVPNLSLIDTTKIIDIKRGDISFNKISYSLSSPGIGDCYLNLSTGVLNVNSSELFLNNEKILVIISNQSGNISRYVYNASFGDTSVLATDLISTPTSKIIDIKRGGISFESINNSSVSSCLFNPLNGLIIVNSSERFLRNEKILVIKTN